MPVASGAGSAGAGPRFRDRIHCARAMATWSPRSISARALNTCANWHANFTCATPISCSAGATRRGRPRSSALFGPRRLTHYPGLYGRRSAAAINLAFDENFPGDRVAAFVEGMRTMLMDAYGGKQRFYLIDILDPQKLHYLARNFEIAFWKLGHDREPDGRLYLLSNSLRASGNLSFERLAGKLIASAGPDGAGGGRRQQPPDQECDPECCLGRILPDLTPGAPAQLPDPVVPAGAGWLRTRLPITPSRFVDSLA